ncbi:MAG TPA: PQQ-binding-like beta-propeller repeat protein [Pseudomonadales bacterium]
MPGGRGLIGGIGIGLVWLAGCSDPGSLAREASAATTVPPADAPAGQQIYRQRCAGCHDGAVKKAPHREMLALMTPEAILHALDHGIMKDEAAPLASAERVQVAEYLAGAALGTAAATDVPACDGNEPAIDLSDPPAMRNWGLSPTNARYIDAAAAGLTAGDLRRLEADWAVAFPGANRVRSQPTLAGGLVLVGSHGGKVYALDEETGCVHWAFQAAGEVRTGIVVAPWRSGDAAARPLAWFGDVLGNVYAIDLATGDGVWRQRADEHPNATITGTPSYYDGVLYVPVSSLEVSLAIDPTYECCTFRGSVAAYDAATGEKLWQTYTIDEPAVEQSRNRAGTVMRGPSGAVVWNSPAIDVARKRLYAATGENMSSPATLTSDAIFALELDSGKIVWMYQATANDVWNVACDTETDHSCPPENGPDFDFGAAVVLARTSDGRDLVIGGQKSGVVHALDPDTGKLVWKTRVGRGGIQGGVHFGMALAGDRLFVPISDMPDGRTYPDPARPGLHALDIRTGELEWYAPAPDVCNARPFCHPGISQAVTAVGNMVFAGGMDGVLRVHDAASGEVLWQLDTTRLFATNDGRQTSGGSFGGAAGPVVRDGRVLVSSGYGIYNHMPGNLLLALSASGPRRAEAAAPPSAEVNPAGQPSRQPAQR